MLESTDAPRNWRDIAEEAAVQKDPTKLRDLILELERALSDELNELPRTQAA